MPRRLTALTAAALAALAAAALLTPSASAAVVTYTSTDVPKTIGDGATATSVLHAPGNLPPVTDLNIVGVRVASSAGNNSDKYLYLRAPNDGEASMLGGTGGCTTLGFNITYDDQAAAAFTAPGDCSATGARRPSLGTLSRLFAGDEFKGPNVEGTWTMNFVDPGALAPGTASLNGWGLRVTFAAMTCKSRAKKQPLKKKLKVEVKCDSDAKVKAFGDAKRRSFNAHAGSDEVKVPLKGGARNRLEGGGKAKIKLEASNELGDVLKEKVKVKITG
jgi:hypothetical protein